MTTYNIRISKAGKSIEVDFDSLPQVSKDFIIQYGLKQKLNDKGAGETIKELGAEEAGSRAWILANQIVDGFKEGKITVRNSVGKMTLEERCLQTIIRKVFKAVCKSSLEKEVDKSNEALLQRIAKTKSSTPEAILTKIKPLVDSEIEAERKKQEEAVDFDELLED